MAGGKNNANDLEQVQRFKEAARALGCDEDEAAFDEKLKALARQKPKDGPKPEKLPRPRKAKQTS